MLTATPAPRPRYAAAPLRLSVLDTLRTAIVEGRLAPGARLVERDLITMTGVSRTVIREVLRQLESEGLVDIIPNKGPVVRTLSLAEAKDLYRIRSVLEGLAARRFAAKATPEHVRALRRALEATAAAYREHDPEIILKTKNRFYDVLFDGAGSETLSSMIATLHARIWRWRALGLAHPRRSPTRSEESVGSLRRLLAAIEAREAAQAEAIIRREVDNAAAEITRLLADADPPRRADQSG